MSNRLIQELRSLIKLSIVAIIIATIVYYFGFNLMSVQGHSMQPTLHDGDRMFVNRAVFLLADPNIADLVILKEPEFDSWSDPYLVKRVVAVAGDSVEIRGGILYRNGMKVTETYTDVAIEDGDWGPDTVREGYVFVLGDNRHLGSSKDSRYFGQVALDSIVGRADWRIWPMERWGELE